MATMNRAQRKQDVIFSIFEALSSQYSVSADGNSGTEKNTVRIAHVKAFSHGIGVKFTWTENSRYVGKVIWGKGSNSRMTDAVISIKSTADATQFVAAYLLLAKLRAKRRRRSKAKPR
jgi:hypothetical protein